MRRWLQRWLGIADMAGAVTALSQRIRHLESGCGIGPGAVRDMQRRLDAVVVSCGNLPTVRTDLARLVTRVELLEEHFRDEDSGCT